MVEGTRNLLYFAHNSGCSAVWSRSLGKNPRASVSGAKKARALGEPQIRLPWGAVQPVQTRQSSLSGLGFNSLGQIGEALNTRFNLMDSPFGGSNRLFD